MNLIVMKVFFILWETNPQATAAGVENVENAGESFSRKLSPTLES